MASTSGVVTLTDPSKTRCDIYAGLTIPIPPIRIRRANKSLSTLEQGGQPVKAGIGWC